MPNRCCILRISLRMRRRRAASRLESGSSRSRTSGFGNQGPRQCDTLLLAARKLAGHAFFIAHKANETQILHDFSVNLVLGLLFDGESVRHVVIHRHGGKYGVILKYNADVPVLGRHLIYPPVPEVHIAGARGLEACDHAQEGGFSATRGSEKGYHFAFFDFYGKIVHRGDGAEFLGQIIYADINHF
jgi:hypothetical protein